jgi:hypothetical protein
LDDRIHLVAGEVEKPRLGPTQSAQVLGTDAEIARRDAKPQPPASERLSDEGPIEMRTRRRRNAPHEAKLTTRNQSSR